MAARGDPLAADFFVVRIQGSGRPYSSWPHRIETTQWSAPGQQMEQIWTAIEADRYNECSNTKQLAPERDRMALQAFLKI
jgi:hypothetical protein